jgi:hypothetical protein
MVLEAIRFSTSSLTSLTPAQKAVEFLTRRKEVVGLLPRDVVILVGGEVIHWGLRPLTESYSKASIAHFTTQEEIV